MAGTYFVNHAGYAQNRRGKHFRRTDPSVRHKRLYYKRGRRLAPGFPMKLSEADAAIDHDKMVGDGNAVSVQLDMDGKKGTFTVPADVADLPHSKPSLWVPPTEAELDAATKDQLLIWSGEAGLEFTDADLKADILAGLKSYHGYA